MSGKLADVKTARSLCLAAALLAACRSAHGVPDPEVLDPTQAPEQIEESPAATSITVTLAQRSFRLAPLARYHVTARLLSRERYYLGWRAELSPIDLALGWGKMADPGVDRFIDWHQGGRWYFFEWSGDSPYRNDDIIPQSANLHAVPASANVRRALLNIGRDQVLSLWGHLIRISSEGAGPEDYWQSSLSRTDTGDGSCELMYVERVVTAGLEYR
jgi:hypothetical protein